MAPRAALLPARAAVWTRVRHALAPRAAGSRGAARTRSRSSSCMRWTPRAPCVRAGGGEGGRGSGPLVGLEGVVVWRHASRRRHCSRGHARARAVAGEQVRGPAEGHPLSHQEEGGGAVLAAAAEGQGAREALRVVRLVAVRAAPGFAFAHCGTDWQLALGGAGMWTRTRRRRASATTTSARARWCAAAAGGGGGGTCAHMCVHVHVCVFGGACVGRVGRGGGGGRSLTGSNARAP